MFDVQVPRIRSNYSPLLRSVSRLLDETHRYRFYVALIRGLKFWFQSREKTMLSILEASFMLYKVYVLSYLFCYQGLGGFMPRQPASDTL